MAFFDVKIEKLRQISYSAGSKTASTVCEKNILSAASTSTDKQKSTTAVTSLTEQRFSFAPGLSMTRRIHMNMNINFPQSKQVKA